MGATTIIAVDVLGRLNLSEKRYNMFNLLTRVFDIVDDKNTYDKLEKLKPDVLIVPELGNISQYKFANYEMSYQAGYDAVTANIDRIKQVIEENNEKFN